MIVELIAHTQMTSVSQLNMNDAGWVDYTTNDPSWITDDADILAEFAGRLCYQSWERPNPGTATNRGYLSNIISQRHFSVLEHASATFYVAGVSRSLSHELVRHRHLSFSQVSQRYVDESNPTFITPPALVKLHEKLKNEAGYRAQALVSQVRSVSDETTDVYKILVERLTANGYSRKEARQAARCVLPNAVETKFVVTGNLRAWREVIEKRGNPAADEEIQDLAYQILRHLVRVAPNTFQDMWDRHEIP